MATHVESMYGVAHGAIEYGYKEVHREPSWKLREALGQLPPGTPVGIEYHRDLKRAFRIGSEQAFFTFSFHYWQSVAEICSMLELPIIYLDDAGINLKGAGHALKAYQNIMLGNKLLESDNSDLSENERLATATDYYRRAYYHDVFARHIQEVQREQVILDNIVRYHPTVVILGRGHGNIFMYDQDILHKKGVSVGQYHAEPDRWSLLSGAPVDESSEWFDRQWLMRQYDALTVGRIAPALNPQYIGYWEGTGAILEPERGLFELFIDPTGVHGNRMLDTIGDATISVDTLTDEKVSFTKVYEPEFSSAAASSGPIVYQGERQGDEYRGTWAAGPYSSSFIMKSYTPGMRLIEPLVTE